MKKKKLFSLIIIAVCIISTVIGVIRREPDRFFDTISYVKAADMLGNGQWDTFRTPPYPLFIFAAKAVCPAAWEILIFSVQLVVFYFSVYVFHRLANDYLKSETIAFIATVLYCAYPIFNVFNLLVATESFAISGCVFTLWIIFSLLQKPSLKWGILSFLLSTFLIWLRPSLLVIPLSYLCLAAILLFQRNYRRTALLLFASAICSLITYIPYSSYIYSKTGVRTISTVSTINEYACSRMGGALFPEYFTDPETATQIIEQNTRENGDSYCGGIYLEINSLVEVIGWSGIDHYNKELRKNQPALCVSQAISRLYGSVTEQNNKKNIVFYLITLAFTFCTIAKLINRKEFNQFDFMLIFFSGGVILTAVIGGQNEWCRLIFPMIPSAFIMLGELLLELNEFCGTKLCRRLRK